MARRFTAEEWPEFVLEGVLKSEELPTDNTDITASLREAIERYENRLAGTLGEWIEEHPPKRPYTFDDIWNDDAPYNVLATLNGEGVGIDDGRWDKFYSDRDLQALRKNLKSRLGDVADDTGGGWLNEAFREAAHEDAGREENPRGKKKAGKKKSGKRCSRGEIPIDRKGYTRSDGTRVKRAKYCVPDRGRPGKTSFGAEGGTRKGSKPLIKDKGALGGPGYTKKSATERHKLLAKCVERDGYRSCLGRLQVLLLSTQIDPHTRKAIQDDKKWLVNTYGGKGSFGPRRAKRGKSRRSNPAVYFVETMVSEGIAVELSDEDLAELEEIAELDDDEAIARLHNGGWEPNEREAHELSLYVTNAAELQPARAKLEKQLVEQANRLGLDPTRKREHDAYRAWVKEGAKRYKREFPASKGYEQFDFNDAVIDEVAESYVSDFQEYYDLGWFNEDCSSRKENPYRTPETTEQLARRLARGHTR